MNLDDYNELLWNELSLEQKQEYLKLYFNKYNAHGYLRLSKDEKDGIRRNSLNGIKSNYEPQQDNHKNINSICPICGKKFEMLNNQLYGLTKDNEKPIFCSRQCASTYTTTQWHKEKTEEEKAEISKKISNTLKGQTIDEDRRKELGKQSKAYWEGLTKEERSKRNKEAYWNSEYGKQQQAEKNITVKCAYCEKEFKPSAYQKRQMEAGKQVFCNTSCALKRKYST